MEIEREFGEGPPVLLVRGEMDVDTAYRVPEAVTAVLEEERSREVVLDLSEVSFVDSVGLGMLVRTQDDARSFDAAVRLRAPSGPVRRLLTLTGLETLFTIDEVAPE